MGAIVSLFDPPSVVDPFLGNHDRPYFEYFGINKFDGGPLVQLYNKMSKTKQGRVTVKTALSKLGIKKNAFMERMFSLLDLQSMTLKPSLDHKQFIYVLWNFATIGVDIPALVMSLYDEQRTQKLTREDVLRMMREVHGWRLEQHMADLMRAIRGIELTGLSLAEFQIFILKNKNSLEPVSKALETLQMKTLGKSRWTALARKRQERWEGRFVDLYDVLADMKAKTGCPDHIISLEQFNSQIAKNKKYKAELEEKKRAKMNKGKIEPKEEEEKESKEGSKDATQSKQKQKSKSKT